MTTKLSRREWLTASAGLVGLGALSKSFEEDFSVAHGAEAHGQPTELRTQRFCPLRVQQRPKGAQMRSQLPSRDASLMNSGTAALRPVKDGFDLSSKRPTQTART